MAEKSEFEQMQGLMNRQIEAAKDQARAETEAKAKYEESIAKSEEAIKTNNDLIKVIKESNKIILRLTDRAKPIGEVPSQMALLTNSLQSLASFIARALAADNKAADELIKEFTTISAGRETKVNTGSSTTVKGDLHGDFVDGHKGDRIGRDKL